MCGLSFILDPAANGVGRRLQSLHAPIRHRGPDGEGFAGVTRYGSFRGDARGDDTIAGLAFRRLKILDLSDAAMQPMLAPGGRTAILFNGEIYNFRALRDELRARGRTFRTTGDTEVVLAAYEEWKEGAFARLEGMWAIIIVDLAQRRVVASRDRFGIKPLHYAIAGGVLMLASEARQIIAATDGRPRANAHRVAQHLRGNRYPVTNETFFDGIRVVPAATWFEMPFDSVTEPTFREYWKLSDFTSRPRAYDDALRDFETALTDAVRSHHVADVAIGSLLSGGLDSSMITTLLADIGREEGRRFPTFSFGFRGAHEEVSELQYVEEVVRQQSLENYETSFDAQWVAANASRVVESVEEPPLAMPVLAQFRTFELCRDHGARVILDGQGSDEILGGYPYHQRILLMEKLRRGQAGSFYRELSTIAARRGSSFGREAFDFFGAPLAGRLRRARPLVAADYGQKALPEVANDRSRDGSAVNRRAHYDVRWGNVKIILDYADRNAMAHSIEARVPFFDRVLVELAFSLPADFKVGGGDRKRILRDFARKRLPARVTERTDRMGFGTPDDAFISGPLRGRIIEAIADARMQSLPFLDRTRLRRLEAQPESDPRAAWRVFTLALWRDVFQSSF